MLKIKFRILKDPQFQGYLEGSLRISSRIHQDRLNDHSGTPRGFFRIPLEMLTISLEDPEGDARRLKIFEGICNGIVNDVLNIFKEILTFHGSPRTSLTIPQDAMGNHEAYLAGSLRISSELAMSLGGTVSQDVVGYPLES